MKRAAAILKMLKLHKRHEKPFQKIMLVKFYWNGGRKSSWPAWPKPENILNN